MDKYDKYASHDMLKVDSTPIPSQRVARGSNLEKFFPAGTKLPPIYKVEVSHDKFLEFMQHPALQDKNRCYYFIIDDEVSVSDRNELASRFYFLKYLNQFPNSIFNFCLSDSTMPAYISFMNTLDWKHEGTTLFQLTMDHNFNAPKNYLLHMAKGKIMLDEEHLLWLDNQTLSVIRNKVEPAVMEDTLKLKRGINTYMDQLSTRYHVPYFNEFDHAYMAYHYLFDNPRNPKTDLLPLGIGYAESRTYEDRQGIQRLNPSFSRWESKPAGTLEHKKGVCTGQARLLASFLCNPEVKVAATSVFGDIPSGERHCWVEMNIHGLNYQCCTSIKGLFADLEAAGYVPLDNQYFALANHHMAYNEASKEAVAKHVKAFRK